MRADDVGVPREQLDATFMEGILFLIAAHFGLSSVLQVPFPSKLELGFDDRVVTYDIANFVKLLMLFDF